MRYLRLTPFLIGELRSAELWALGAVDDTNAVLDTTRPLFTSGAGSLALVPIESGSRCIATVYWPVEL